MIKRILKYLGIGLGGLLLLVAGAIAFVLLKPVSSQPASTTPIERTDARLERGRYLAENVLACLDCHSERNKDVAGWPVLAGTEGSGQCHAKWWDRTDVCFPNITPHPTAGIGQWSDGELVRAIREGISRDGSPISAGMPYESYRHLSDEDVKAVVVWLRSLPPRDTVRTRLEHDLPTKLYAKFAAKPVEGVVPTPSDSDSVARGRYLADIGRCAGCHSPDSGDPFQGGYSFPGGEAHSESPIPAMASNITPDPETGIGQLSKEAFISLLKSYEGSNEPGTGKAISTWMPWRTFAGMHEEDLGALHDFLFTQKPVVNRPALAVEAP